MSKMKREITIHSSAEQAKLYTELEYEKYRIIQERLFVSDFDKYMLELESLSE